MSDRGIFCILGKVKTQKPAILLGFLPVFKDANHDRFFCILRRMQNIPCLHSWVLQTPLHHWDQYVRM